MESTAKRWPKPNRRSNCLLLAKTDVYGRTARMVASCKAQVMPKVRGSNTDWPKSSPGMSPLSRITLGQTYLMRSNFVEALKYYEASIKLVPEHLNGRYWKARTLEELGRFEDAIHEFEEHDKLKGPILSKPGASTTACGMPSGRMGLKGIGADGSKTR